MKKRGRIFKVSVSILALFLVWIFVAPFLAQYLIVRKPLEKADAILILGGSSVYIERTQKAAALYKQGISPKCLLTFDGEKAGWSQEEKRNPPFVDLARNELISQGVPAEAIETLEPTISGTFFEAETVRKLVAERNLKSLLIVTSAYHTRRALWIFQKDFAENNIQIEVGIEPALVGQQTPTTFTWWLTPHGWMLVGGEYVKAAYYWMFY